MADGTSPLRSRLTLSLLWVWALGGLWVGYAGILFAAYRYALGRGLLPSTLWPNVPETAIIVAFVLSGLVALALVNVSRIRARPLTAIVVGVAYTAIAYAGMPVAHIFVACANGDCL